MPDPEEAKTVSFHCGQGLRKIFPHLSEQHKSDAAAAFTKGLSSEPDVSQYEKKKRKREQKALLRTLEPPDSHAAPLLSIVEAVQLLIVLSFCDTPVAQIMFLGYVFALRLDEAIWVEPEWVAELTRSADLTKQLIPSMPVEKTKATLARNSHQGNPLTKRAKQLWVQLLSHEHSDIQKAIEFFLLAETEPEGKPPANHGWYRPAKEGEWLPKHWQRVWAFTDSKFCIARAKTNIDKFSKKKD